MIKPLLTLLVILVVLLLSEYLWLKKRLRGESARKLVHIIVISFGAFWPFYMSWEEIRIVCIVSIVLALIVRKLGLFKGVYDIDRKSWGEIIGTVGTFTLTYLNLNKWIFAAAILHVGLADGLAALVGIKYGKSNRYKVFGHTKSLAGTFIFGLVSLAILLALSTFQPSGVGQLSIMVLLCLPVLATLTENFSPYGSDNFFVSILVAVALLPVQLSP